MPINSVGSRNVHWNNKVGKAWLNPDGKNQDHVYVEKESTRVFGKKTLYVYILLVINPDPTTELNIPLTSNDQDMLSDKTQITFRRFGSFSLTRGYLRLHIRGIMRGAITHPYPVDVKP